MFGSDGSAQQLVRFVIEQYRDELTLQLRGTNDGQALQEHEAAVAEGREAVASDLLNVLHSIPIQSIATNGPSLVSHKVLPSYRQGHDLTLNPHFRSTKFVLSLLLYLMQSGRLKQPLHRLLGPTPTSVRV